MRSMAMIVAVWAMTGCAASGGTLYLQDAAPDAGAIADTSVYLLTVGPDVVSAPDAIADGQALVVVDAPPAYDAGAGDAASAGEASGDADAATVEAASVATCCLFTSFDAASSCTSVPYSCDTNQPLPDGGVLLAHGNCVYFVCNLGGSCTGLRPLTGTVVPCP